MLRSFLFLLAVVLLIGCAQDNTYDKIKHLERQGKALEAKPLFEQLVSEDSDIDLKRSYIQFLFDNKFYLDFRQVASAYLRDYPNDLTIKNLNFKYYAILAENSEQQGDYDQAIEYIINNLLSMDYEDRQHWELQQSNVLRKWYGEEKMKEDNLLGRKHVMSKMIALGLNNLANSLDPELYNEMDLGNPEVIETPANEPEVNEEQD